MTDFNALFAQYLTGSAKEQERAAKQMAQAQGAASFLLSKLSSPERRAALALLGRAARRDSVRWQLKDKTNQIEPLLAKRRRQNP